LICLGIKTTRKLIFVLLALLVSGCAALSDFRPPARVAPGNWTEPYADARRNETAIRPQSAAALKELRRTNDRQHS